MTADVAESAHGEMEYKEDENKFTGNEYPVSIPCQLRFTEEPEQDTERFHNALAERGWSKLTHEPDKYQEPGKPNWQGEITRTGKWNRLQVIVFRSDLVRIFPYEDGVTVEGLAEVIEALEEGFDAPLTHEPLREDGGTADTLDAEPGGVRE